MEGPWGSRLDPVLQEKLYKAQELLSKRIVVSDEWLDGVGRIGGVDASYRGDLAAVGFSVFNLSEKRITLVSVRKTVVKVPYVPTLLSFREGPVVLRTLRRFSDEYDLLIVNGHGLAHPRNCGLATYLGVILKKPTIGVARKPLGGLEEEYNINNLRMFEEKFYYSVGNMITMDGAYNILRRVTPSSSKLPIPLEVAHRLSLKMVEMMIKNVERV
jgi:deoxyribonuclease V